MKNNCMLPLPDGWGMLFVRSLPCCSKKEQHAAAHELLEESLRAYCHAHKRPVPALDFAYGEAGKPSLPSQPGLFFNLTHCEGLAACLVSDCECGVDAEPIRTLRPRVAERVCAPEEKQMLADAADPDLLFTRFWTLKESYVKAIGIGISYPMASVCFVPEDTCIRSNRKEAAFAQFLLTEHVVSVCLLCTKMTQPVLSLSMF